MTKKLLLLVSIVLVLAVALGLAACGTKIDNGKIDDNDLPVKVEVTGLEGITGSAEASLLDEAQQAAAMAAVKAVYYIADGAETYAVDIKIVDDNGKEITVGKPITVSITLPDTQLPLDQYVVFHIHDGDAEQIVPNVADGKLTFTVSGFSPFVVVPVHTHAYGEWRTYSEATCTEAKMELRECVCGAKETRNMGTALGHDMTHHEMVTESCTEDGNVEFFSCSRCGKDFLEAEGFTEILPANTIVPATGHVDADTDGKCDKCGITIGGNGGETPHTHTFGDWKPLNGTLPTCTTSAWEIRECACGEVEKKEVPALGHIDENSDDYCDRCSAYLGGENPQGDLPCTVDVMGANGSVLTADVQALSETDKAAALGLIKAKYDFADGDTYAVDITIKGAAVGTVARICIGLKNPALSLDQYAVYHIHEGEIEMIVPEVSGANLVFMVSSFSPFVIGPKHLHQPSTLIEVTPATCEKDGVGYIECIKCHDKLSTQTIPATGHIDENEDGKCDVCGADLKEKPDTLNAYVEGKVFKFDHATGEGVNNATYATAYADATLTFFAENYMEYHVFKSVRGGNISAFNVVLCGTYSIEESEDGLTITLTVTKRYYDDEETMIPFPTYAFVYDIATATVAITEAPATIFYSEDTEATPTKYTTSLADNWDDNVIINAFKAVGATKDYTLPKLDNVLTMTKGAVDNGRVTVTIVMSSKMHGAEAAGQYKALLEGQYYSYTAKNAYDNTETRVNTDDNLFRFVVATSNIDEYAALTITISPFAAEYPDAGIVNYLAEQDMTDAIPVFLTPWAMQYQFITDISPAVACIHVRLRYREGIEQHDTAVAALYREMAQAQEYGYTTKAEGGKTYLCSPNDQIVLFVVLGKEGDSVDIYINDDSVFYPAAQIAAYLTGTTDAFLSLADDSVAVYKLFDNEEDNPTGLRLVGDLPATADAHAIADRLKAAFAEAGYKWGGFGTHFGNEEDVSLYHHAWMSPNNQIAVMFDAFDQGEHKDGAHYSVSIVNLTAIPADNKAIMTSLDASGYSPAVQLGGAYTFDGGITYMYTNVGTGLEGGEMYSTDLSMFNVGTIDTSIPGQQTLHISLKGNDEIYTDITILVWALTSIEATANKLKIDGRVAYYYGNSWIDAKYYTITRHYSDGATDTVKGDDDSVVFGTIDMTKAQQDLSISCTVSGVTVSTTVAIGVFRSFNFTCTNQSDIDANGAQFAVYAVGGTYGTGGWVNVNYESRRGSFGGTAYMDADGIYFVRLSPDLDVFDGGDYDLESEGVWQVSAYFDLASSSVGMQEFAFLDLA